MAASRKRLNAVHLLIEANANINAKNEAGQTPAMLCEDDPSIYAILTGVKNRDINGGTQKMSAAKEIMSTAVDPISSSEERIIFACEKAANDAKEFKEAPLTSYAEVKDCLLNYKSLNEEFKSAIKTVEEYRAQLDTNKACVDTMAQTLDESEHDVEARLMRRRTACTRTRNAGRDVDARLEQAESELESVAKEFAEAERRFLQLKERKERLEEEVEQLRQDKQSLAKSGIEDSNAESEITREREELAASKQLIGKGFDMLKQISSDMSQRLLDTALEYSDFLRRYDAYVSSVIGDVQNKEERMLERVSEQKENINEIEALELNMDSKKIESLIDDYMLNNQRFVRRVDKIKEIRVQISRDANDLKKILGMFGRQLQDM